VTDGAIGVRPSLSGRVVVVTGGAERVGRVVALCFAEAGADIVINHLGQPRQAMKTADEIEQRGCRCVIVEADVAETSSGDAIVQAADHYFGRIDVLVHNASNFISEELGSVTPSKFDESFAVILRGPFFLSQIIGNYMYRQGWGKMFAIAGNSLYETWPQHAAHTLAKTALARMMEIFAIGLSPVVQCNVVAPHRILPSAGEQDREVVARRGEAIGEPGGITTVTPFARLRQPDAEDVGSLLVLLASAPDTVTGTVVRVDGGRAIL
jgi:NAD(P)-dependent dehydrogenase (short-subunit alcohol dehydrogenase family)